MILQVFLPPFRPGSAHVVSFRSISQGPCDLTGHESEQRERRLPQRRAKSSDRSPENRHHGFLLALFGRRSVLISDKSIALQSKRRIANAAEAQLTCKPPELGLCNDPEHGTKEAPRPASASSGHRANGLGHRSSEAIVAWQGIRPGTTQWLIACRIGKPVVDERWVRHLLSPSRPCAACQKMSRRAYKFESRLFAFA